MRPSHFQGPCALLLIAMAVANPGSASSATIGSLHCNGPDGTPLLKGQSVTVSGVVVGQFSVERSIKLYVEDATGALNVFGSPKNCVPVGVSVRVTDPEGCDLSNTLEGQPIPVDAPVRVVGILSQYAGRTQGHGGYQVLPRGRDDIQVMTAKPASAPAKP